MVGTFTQPITLISESGGEPGQVDALVDSGAMFSAFPRPLLERLGVRAFDQLPVRFANGQVENWEMGLVDAELNGVRRPIVCLFGSADAPPLIGAHALEVFLLAVDPVEEKLVPKEAYLMGSGDGRA